jgi:hypothetical protein
MRVDSGRDKGRPASTAGLAWLGGFIVLGLSTCFDPHVTPHGLTCAPGSAAGEPGRCPDGFVCVGGFCDAIGGSGVGGKGGLSGPGGAAGGGPGGGGATCANPIAQLCSAKNETPCDPVCQTGCPCGLRCAVSGPTSQCVAPSTVTPPKQEGDVCDSSGPDVCAPGFVCAMEACGVGRCYRVCSDRSQCVSEVCQAHSGIVHKVCSLPQLSGAQGCDPLAPPDSNRCPSPVLTCFALGAKFSFCDCPPKGGKEGETCSNYQNCDQGLVCIGPDPTKGTCYRLCDSGANQCPTTTCMPIGSGGSFSYCPLP